MDHCGYHHRTTLRLSWTWNAFDSISYIYPTRDSRFTGLAKDLKFIATPLIHCFIAISDQILSPQIVLFGPECSGKSTLAKALTEHYSGVLVPEYLRTYAQHIWDTQKRVVAQQDIRSLIEGQLSAQQEGLEAAQKKAISSLFRPCPVFLDTDIHQLAVYFRYYFGSNWGQIPPLTDKSKAQTVYLLMQPDIPWQADDLRDQPLERDALFSIFKADLIQRKAHFIEINGAHNQRMDQACKFINKIWPNLHV